MAVRIPVMMSCAPTAIQYIHTYKCPQDMYPDQPHGRAARVMLLVMTARARLLLLLMAPPLTQLALRAALCIQYRRRNKPETDRPTTGFTAVTTNQPISLLQAGQPQAAEKTALLYPFSIFPAFSPLLPSPSIINPIHHTPNTTTPPTPRHNHLRKSNTPPHSSNQVITTTAHTIP